MRIYRALLVLYPRAFRRSYRGPMEQVFGDLRRDRGRRAWLRTIPDLLTSVPRLRIEAAMSNVNSAPRVVALALFVLGGAVVAFGAGGPLAIIVLVAMVGVGYGQRRLVASARKGGRAPLRRAVLQTWWAPVAALIGLGEVLFGIGTAFEAHNWGGRIIGSSAMVACGATMLFGLVRRPFSREAGNAMILIATIPAFLFFWVIGPTVLALVVWIGVITSGFSEDAVAPA